MDAVRTRDLTKRYGKIEALAGLDVRIPEGSIFGVLGPNGAGKSTLIRAVCGITKPTSGTVTVLGADATSERRRLRKRIGYMPQEPALYEDLSPLQNLRFFAGAYGIHDTERRISGVLDLLELTGRADSPVYGLSGGTKQRVSLGCALVHGPDLLLLDEPTAGMDPRLRKRFWEHFGALGREGKTIVELQRFGGHFFAMPPPPPSL
ncbi:MAG: ABC transporter ATP-binding protein [Actinomycetota bacterium]|nr:ABC transporter ATP-binding protein [Actinomycetota bacterium]